MSALIEYQKLIDLVAGTIAKLKGVSSTSSHSFRTQQDYELYEGVGPLTFEQLTPKVRDAVSLLLNSLNSDIVPHFQRFQKLWSGSWHGGATEVKAKLMQLFVGCSCERVSAVLRSIWR